MLMVKINMDCSSRNILHLMKCEGCGEEYIGETGNDLRKQLTSTGSKSVIQQSTRSH